MPLSYKTWKFVVRDKKKTGNKENILVQVQTPTCLPAGDQPHGEPENILFIIYILFMATSLSVLFHCISASWHSSLYHMTHHLQRACSCWSNTRVIHINFLLTITIHYQRNGFKKYWNDHQENASIDLLTNSLFSLFP